MKKTGSFGSRSGVKKQPETKASSLSRSAGKVGSGSGSLNRRSPVVTDATIATSSVIQAATDPKIKELVMKQQQIFERESMDKRTPRNRSAEAASALFHSLDHPPSAHHSSHQQSFWKHASFGDSDLPVCDSVPETPEKPHSKFMASSPELHQQQHAHFHAPNTPGSAIETVVHHELVGGAQNDDDGVSSELTADAGYMSLQQRCAAAPPLPTMNEHASSMSPAGPTLSTSSPSMRGYHMHAYMDLNSTLLHEHTSGHPVGGGKEPHQSPLLQGLGTGHGPPMPPPLTLPAAAHGNTDNSGNNLASTSGSGGIPLTSTSATTTASTGAPHLPDPRELDDNALRAAYLRFLVEMETRGLHSLSLNPALAALSLSSSSSNVGGHGPAVTAVDAAHGAIAYNERAPAAQPAPGANVTPKPAPTTSHASLPPHANPNINPVDIRKNVPRSRSGGSESAFYPNGFPTAANANMSGVGSGRKTPNSPLMGRYMHSTEVVHEELHWVAEGEDAELRKAFGQYRHPGSPSYPAYSPFHHLSSGAPQPSYLAQHSAHTQGHHSGSTPTSVAVGSANWATTSAPAPATTTTATASSHTATNGHSSAHGAATSRSVSRCSGVVPQLAHDDILPAMRNNCLSTLPPTYSQYMYTQSTATGAASNAQGAATTVAADLKTPKFVRKFQGIGAGLLGLTAQRYAHMEGDQDDSSMEVEAAPIPAPAQQAAKNRTAASSQPAVVQVGGPGKSNQGTMATHGSGSHTGSSAVGGSSRSSGHHRDNLHSKSSEFDNSIDAVKIAGGFDQLLLPNRLLNKRNSSLIPDEHSAFDDCSVGSMSLNSARSGGKKSAKTR